MKICMVGLGSIGKRHLGNLIKVLEKRNMPYQIDALRSIGLKLEEKYGSVICCEYHHIEEMPNDYDIIFITNPTSLHYNTVKQVIQKTKHMFIEKPVFDSDYYDLATINWHSNSMYYVACPLRHKCIMQYIKGEVLKNNRVIAARILSTSYLPGWRKGVDYRNVYSSKKSLGGGVTKDLIHEWDYAIYLFGIPDKIFHLEGRLSNLDIDCEDVSIYMAKYPAMLLEMHLDYIGHKEERIIQLFTDENRMDIDLIQNIVYEYQNNKLVSKNEFPKEDFYLNEMEYFIDCVEGKQSNINTVKDAYRTLKVALKKE